MVRDESAKTVKIMCLKNLALYSSLKPTLTLIQPLTSFTSLEEVQGYVDMFKITTTTILQVPVYISTQLILMFQIYVATF